jgi:hypothetical protein
MQVSARAVAKLKGILAIVDERTNGSKGDVLRATIAWRGVERRRVYDLRLGIGFRDEQDRVLVEDDGRAVLVIEKAQLGKVPPVRLDTNDEPTDHRFFLSPCNTAPQAS